MTISRLLSSIVIIGAMLACSAATSMAMPAIVPAETKDNPKVNEDKSYRAATFRVRTPGGTGSGFAIGPNLVVTCAHVVLNDNGQLESPVMYLDAGNDKKNIAARVVYYDREADIALMETDETFSIFYKIAENPPEAEGTQIAIVRSRPDYVAKFSRTKIKETWMSSKGTSVLVERRIEFGNSGSPVVNSKYEVVGYITSLVSTNMKGIYAHADGIKNAMATYAATKSS